MSEEHSESESSTSTNDDIEVINIDEPVFHSDVEEESSVGEESGDESESVESFDMNIVRYGVSRRDYDGGWNKGKS